MSNAHGSWFLIFWPRSKRASHTKIGESIVDTECIFRTPSAMNGTQRNEYNLGRTIDVVDSLNPSSATTQSHPTRQRNTQQKIPSYTSDYLVQYFKNNKRMVRSKITTHSG